MPDLQFASAKDYESWRFDLCFFGTAVVDDQGKYVSLEDSRLQDWLLEQAVFAAP